MTEIVNGCIDYLKTSNEYMAREIVQLQKESYEVEARIIGTNCIPVLYDTVECIKNTDETFIGYKVNRELLGLLSYKYEYGILDIHRLAVNPEHFKKGIASKLLEKVLSDHEDAQKVIVATGSKNKPALKLYTKLGFRVMREFEVEENVMISQLELIDSPVEESYAQRDESVMMDIIKNFVYSRDDIRAALMNGSRVNSKVKRDAFQDYDIVYVVEDPSKYKEDQSWIAEFGETLIVQQNDIETGDWNYPIYLMQFSDCNRIDLKFLPLEMVHERESDTLEAVLVDKDAIIGALPDPSDSGYVTERPEAQVFLECINNILWCSTNVVKGLRRGEFNYAKRMQEQIVRADLNTVMRWYIASKHNWNINTGVFGKWMEAYLTKDEWAMYLETCAGADYEAIWDAMIKMIDLASYYGNALAKSLGLEYPYDDEMGVRRYIEMNRI